MTLLSGPWTASEGKEREGRGGKGGRKGKGVEGRVSLSSERYLVRRRQKSPEKGMRWGWGHEEHRL